MKHVSTLRTAGLIGALALAFMTIAAANPVASYTAPDNGTNAVAVDQIIDRMSDRMPVDATAINALQERQQTASANQQPVTVHTPIPLPAGVALRTGENVQVNYSDGVVVHQSLAASCTATSSVGNPYVSNGVALASHSYGLSGGCSATASVNGILSSFAWPWWHQRDFHTVNVSPSSTTYWATRKICVNTGSTTWHAENSVGSSSISLTPDVNLACNPG
ncbi:hypothetical protein EDD25_1600 [Cryobacterium psychrophilum]|nr:hypothetical protein EDD25_1600 [Cryobacterium psychrophilum]